MSSLPEIRAAIRDTIKADYPKMMVYNTVPDVAQVPAFVIAPDTCNYQIGMGGCIEWNFCIYVLVPRTETRLAQDKLDALIAHDGIPGTLREGKYLGLEGVDATLMKMDGYGGSFDTAKIEHVGARLHLKVIVTSP